MEEKNTSSVKLARVASGKSQSDAASVIGVSLPTYAAREKVPGAFTIEELADLARSFNAQGKAIIRDFVSSIFFDM